MPTSLTIKTLEINHDAIAIGKEVTAIVHGASSIAAVADAREQSTLLTSPSSRLVEHGLGSRYRTTNHGCPLPLNEENPA
jgi:hypothetical protein